MSPKVMRKRDKKSGEEPVEGEGEGEEKVQEEESGEEVVEDVDEEEEKEREEMEDVEGKEKKPLRSTLWEVMKDILIAVIIVILIIGSIYVYTGNWPPVVVVESDSMQHSDDESFIGVIDTGDLVLVKSIESENDIITYMKGKRIGHETYSEYGDVVIYRKNGYTHRPNGLTLTPVIHRAIVWLQLNKTTGNTFDIPELKHHSAPDVWAVEGGDNRWYNLAGMLVLKGIGYDHVDVRINLGSILDNYASNGIEPHSGFITLGDHNGPGYDQRGLTDEHGGVVQPVLPKWVIGKARGELPWFGLIKLYFEDSAVKERAPQNSWTYLFISIVLIFAIPICIDIFLVLLERRKARREKEEEEPEEGEEEEEPEEEEEEETEKGE